MKSPSWSLRRRLMALLGLAALASWCTSSVWTYLASVRESEQMFDAALDHTAHAILSVIRNEAAELTEKNGAATLGTELAEIDPSGDSQIIYQVLGPNGRLVFRSHSAPVEMLAGWHDLGFTNNRIGGVDYRVYTVGMELDALTIHIAQPVQRRLESERASALRLLVPGGALLIALMFAVAWTVRRTIQPVVRYANALDAITPESDAAVDGSRLPDELQSVARAIDRLLLRVRDALLRERTLTADAAHELRNPLGALRLQAQVARRARDSGERNAILEELVAGVDRTSRMVDGILTLARFDARSADQLPRARVDVARLARIVAAEFAPVVEAVGIRIEIVGGACEAQGDEDALAVALRNLVANAARFARSRIAIETERQADQAILRVRDDGPGFSPVAAQRAFNRFYRDTERGRTHDGTGLGLALVLRIAQMHGGSAVILPGATGATVEIRVPAWAAAYSVTR